MDDNNTCCHDIHAVDWDEDDADMMAAAVLVIVNTNMAIMDCMMLALIMRHDHQLSKHVRFPSQHRGGASD